MSGVLKTQRPLGVADVSGLCAALEMRHGAVRSVRAARASAGEIILAAARRVGADQIRLHRHGRGSALPPTPPPQTATEYSPY